MEPECMLLTDVEASRRRFLQLAGVTGTAALAGCTGDDSTLESEEITGDEPMTDRTFIAPTSVLPDDMQWNGANDSNYPDRP